MKNRQLLDIMSLVDDKYISESDPQRLKQIASSVPPTKFKWTTFFVAVACCLLVLNLAIFIPLLTRDDPVSPPAPSTPSGGGGLNQVQNPSNDQEDTNLPEDSGNTTIVENAALLDALEKLFSSGAQLENETSHSNGELNFNENPDGDIIKITETHIFYLRGKELCVYSVENGESTLVSMLSLGGYVDEMREYVRSIGWLDVETGIPDNYAYEYGWKMYLSPDQNTLTLIAIPGKSPVTGVLTLDISRTPTVKVTDFKMVSGTYASSHMSNGEVLLFTRYQIQKSYSKEKPFTYMPFYRENNKEIFSENIYFPNNINSSSYLMVTKLDQGNATVKETAAYLSYSDKVYVSGGSIFLTRRIFAGDSSIDYLTVPYNTEISVISYGDGKLQHKGTALVNGYVNDITNLREKDGMLLLATTSFIPKDGQGYIWYETSASLYCIDIKAMKTVSKVENFATAGETLSLVRYEGNFAYAYTSINGILADPVFVFDTSDPENITCERTDTSKGYPTSLIDFGGGYFISIGVGSNSQALKIDIYKKENGKNVTVYSHELKNTYYSTDCNAYYIDSSRKLLGIAMKSYELNVGYTNKYLLLHFDGEGFNTLLSEPLSFSDKNAVRSYYRKGYYYVITDTGVYAYGLEIPK
ncbi:MAG: hypothetical protein E7596_00995 [Ruminococcaceae bacterium]|nr:hypothetical protein [Oscillospiraceae bacterium]